MIQVPFHPFRSFHNLTVVGQAPHGRVPIDVVVEVYNSLHEYLYCEGVLCRKAPQCDLRDPGRGDPGFRHCWSMCFAEHLRVILRCCLFVCCLVVFVQDLLIQKHLMPLLFGAVMPCSLLRFVFVWCCLGCGLWVFGFCCVFVGFSFWNWHHFVVILLHF